MTAAFSVYTNQNTQIDEVSARQAVAAVLRFLKRMGLIRYESHSGYISHVIYEKDLSDVPANRAGISGEKYMRETMYATAMRWQRS